MPDPVEPDPGSTLPTPEAMKPLAPRQEAIAPEPKPNSGWCTWLTMHRYMLVLVLAFVTYVSLTWWKPGGIPASLALAVLLITVVLWFINPVPPPLSSLQQASVGRTWLAMHGYALATLLAFIAYGSLALWQPGGYAASLALAVLLGMVALWFIYCVTGDAQDKCSNLFTFAYAFTFGSFALLLMPVLTDQLPRPTFDTRTTQSEGALRLVRGCVQVQATGGSRTLGERLAPCPPSAAAAAAAAASAASAPGLPDGIIATGYRYAWLISVGGVTARTLAVGTCGSAAGNAALLSDKSDAAAAAAIAASKAASAPAAAASAIAEAIRLEAEAQKVRHEHQQASELADTTCNARGTEDPKRPFVEVFGGVAVPLFVVVLALIGGAVSISRRIPEFQRRNDPNYVSTAEEPFMPPYRVRESVVFQIMQLVSAPFLAIATLQVIEPNNLASASTLAFATGFFSETILYMIRGMVNGLKPELTKVVGQAVVNLTGLLSWQDKLNPGDFAKVRVELQSERPVEWHNVPVDKDGNFAINGVAAGRYKLAVRGEGIIQPVPLGIDVDDKPHKLIEITVTKA